MRRQADGFPDHIETHILAACPMGHHTKQVPRPWFPRVGLQDLLAEFRGFRKVTLLKRQSGL